MRMTPEHELAYPTPRVRYYVGLKLDSGVSLGHQVDVELPRPLAPYFDKVTEPAVPFHPVTEIQIAESQSGAYASRLRAMFAHLPDMPAPTPALRKSQSKKRTRFDDLFEQYAFA